MNIAEYIKAKLESEYHAGATQCELAKKYNSRQTDIQRLLSGQRKVSGLTLETIMKMFPNASLDLTGHGNQGNQQINRDHATGIQNNGPAAPPEEQCAACRHRLQDALMASDLDPASKVKAYRLIQGE